MLTKQIEALNTGQCIIMKMGGKCAALNDVKEHSAGVCQHDDNDKTSKVNVHTREAFPQGFPCESIMSDVRFSRGHAVTCYLANIVFIVAYYKLQLLLARAP